MPALRAIARVRFLNTIERVPTFENECFVMAPIGSPDSSERASSDGVLAALIAPAARSVGLEPVRADLIGEPGQITLQVLDHVLHARAAVADLTGGNPNVFYELAVRHAARLPVALVAQGGERLPFDLAQMRTVFFDPGDLQSIGGSLEALAHQLQRGLDGVIDSPVATAFNVAAARGAGEPIEATLAELLTRVDDLAAEMRALVATQPREPETGVLNRVRQYLSRDTGDVQVAAPEDDSASVVVRAEGDVDLYTSPELKARIIEATDEGRRDLVVDLTGSTFVDATALGVLVGALRRARTRGRWVAIAAKDPDLKKVFRVTGLDSMFVMAETVEEAVTRLESRVAESEHRAESSELEAG